MNESDSISSYLNKHQEIIDENNARSLETFQRDRGNEFLSKLNRLQAEYQNLSRERNNAVSLSSYLNELCNLIKLYKQGILDKEEFQTEKNDLFLSWKRDITRDMADGVRNSSGEALERIQLHRRVGILSEEQTNPADNEKAQNTLIKKLSYLKDLGIDVSPSENFSFQDKLSYLVQLLEEFSLAKTIIFSKTQKDSEYELTQEEKIIVQRWGAINSGILHIMKVFVDDTFISPQRIQSFLLLAKMNAAIKRAEQKMEQKSIERKMLTKQARENGYLYDASLERWYSKE
jgi:hypothetical protein